MTWTKYIPEAAALSFIFAVIVNTLRGFRRAPVQSQPLEELTEDDDEPSGPDIEQARRAAYGLEAERYEAIVSELADCPERWPEWARAHHKAKAHEMLSASMFAGMRGQNLWNAGHELRGLLLVDDANRMQTRAIEMLEQVGEL